MGQRIGALRVYVGASDGDSGKKLIEINEKLCQEDKKVLVVKPLIDMDEGALRDYVESQNGRAVSAIALKSLTTLMIANSKYYDAILIEGIQFYEDELSVLYLDNLCSLGVEVYVFGLHFNSDHKTLNIFKDILTHADKVIYEL